jgi:hypothetical protein
MKVYQGIASILTAIKYSQATNSSANVIRHEERLASFAKKHLPHGSGIDRGVSPYMNDKGYVCFDVDFHVLDENGYYAGWVLFQYIMKPEFQRGFELTQINRRNVLKGWSRQDRKGIHLDGLEEYVADTLAYALDEECEHETF